MSTKRLELHVPGAEQRFDVCASEKAAYGTTLWLVYLSVIAKDTNKVSQMLQ
jgi:hypothetical protein